MRDVTAGPIGGGVSADGEEHHRSGPTVAPSPEPLSDVDGPLDRGQLEQLHAWWRAANYLAVGQIYLLDNPLLREPLRAVHVKPRLLGHWGTTPGLNLVWAHATRLVRERGLDAVFVAGPGHGGPGPNAAAWLEGTYSELYRHISQDEQGMRRFFRQFSFPGGVPSHCAPETPGSFHEGGELGYSLLHAFGAVLDNPDLVAFCVIGDGEAETGSLATSWHVGKLLNPACDGAVVPVPHLNGFKIANPTLLARIPEADLVSLLRGYGYAPIIVGGDDPASVHQQLAAAFDGAIGAIAEIHRAARGGTGVELPVRWPMVVLRTPKGWTGPIEVDGQQVEGTFRSHQVPLPGVRTDPSHLAALDQWLRSYQPEELFDEAGRPVPELLALSPVGARRMSANPHANGGHVGRLSGPGDRARVQEPLAGEVVVLATPYDAALDFAGTRSAELAGKVVVDITNPVDWTSFDRLVTPADSSAAEEIAARAPGARVVKAFNTTFAATLVAGEVAGAAA